MQGLRRAVLQSFAGQQQCQRRSFASAAVKQLQDVDNAIKKETLGLYIMLALCGIFIVRDTFYPEEEFEGVLPPYSYLRIRSKEFPWGENGLLEFRRVVGEKPE